MDAGVAAKRAKLSAVGGGGSQDYLSELSDDLLIHILLKLRSVAVAARTSILSSRWRRVWTLLPELIFTDKWHSRSLRSALSAHEAPVLRRLVVSVRNASPKSLSAWLPIAATRLSGHLELSNMGHDATCVFELPCFQKATSMKLNIGFLSLSLPPSGVFVRLTDIHLEYVLLYGPCRLGDSLFSPQFPALQKLIIRHARGEDNFTIHSKSLLQLELSFITRMQQLLVVAPALEELTVKSCLTNGRSLEQPVSVIAVPRLVVLKWWDAYDPTFVQFGEMPQLQTLHTSIFFVYDLNDSIENGHCVRILRHFMVVHNLNLPLLYLKNIENYRYCVQDIGRLPDITSLTLDVMTNGHCFGDSAFHVLRMCTGVQKLVLNLSKPYTACQSGCVCDQHSEWKTEEIVLDHLQEVEISELTESEHKEEVAFVQRIFSWATVLTKMTISFHREISESKAKELCAVLRSFSRPEICLKFCVCDSAEFLYVPED